MRNAHESFSISVTPINSARISAVERNVLVESAVGGRSKRALDILVASTSLLLVTPVMFAVWVLLRATARGPAIFAHTRIGQTGRHFRCLKFRTMVRDGDELIRTHLVDNPEAASEWKTKRKLRNDPRVTRLGYFLRRSSIDELPQLFNVLKGEMSCIGPRPVVPDELERYGPFAAYYLSTRPGITGLWQTNGRSSLSYADRVRLDVYYVKNWSLWMDVKILLKTPLALLRVGDSM